MAKKHRLLVVLKIPKHVPDLIKTAQAFMKGLADNPIFFPSPQPPLAEVKTHIDAVSSAETIAKTKVQGAVESRDEKRLVVESDLQAWKAYVQKCADANPAQAAAMITAATCSVRKATIRTKNDLSVTQGSTSGEANLTAKAGKGRVSYDWQLSTDQKTWVDLPSTLQSRTKVTGLNPATTYFFRHRKLTKTGREDWGQVVSLLVR